MEIHEIVQKQREYFSTGATLPVEVRCSALKALKAQILAEENELKAALKQDLNKSGFEAYMAEIGMVLDELGYAIKHLKGWAKPERVGTPLAQFPSRSFIIKEPYGTALIMAPWNYPFLLSIDPLIGAVAAGNCVVLKPSAYAPATSHAMATLLAKVFDPAWVTVIEGGRRENASLLDERFDRIFFTGGMTVGRLVMEKASVHLTPVLLELGGKSPIIVDESADIPLAARRIAFGKLLNAGQTCVAPDYLLVQNTVKAALVEELKKQFRAMLGEAPLQNPDYVRIVNRKHFERLLGLLEGEALLCGGGSRDLRPDPARDRVRQHPPGHRLCKRARKAAGALSLHPRQGGGASGAGAVQLWRRLRERHHHPPCHPQHGVRRRGLQRHGQLPRQAQLYGLQPREKHGEESLLAGSSHALHALQKGQRKAAADIPEIMVLPFKPACAKPRCRLVFYVQKIF